MEGYLGQWMTTPEWLVCIFGEATRKPWSSCELSTQLNKFRIMRIIDNFEDLPLQIKLKTLMSVMHIPRKCLMEFKVELEALLKQGLNDYEDAAVFLAEILQPFPSTHKVNDEVVAPENEKNALVYNALAEELKQSLAEAKQAKDLHLTPLECYYLNEKALKAHLQEKYEEGVPTSSVQHFATKRKSKAELLREKLLQSPKKSGRFKRPLPTTPEVEEQIGVRVRVRPTKIFIPRKPPIQKPDS